MIGGGPFNLNPGEWTDDTSMALCLAQSLIATREFNPVDQLERYLRWYEEGYLAATESVLILAQPLYLRSRNSKEHVTLFVDLVRSTMQEMVL